MIGMPHRIAFSLRKIFVGADSSLSVDGIIRSGSLAFVARLRQSTSYPQRRTSASSKSSTLHPYLGAIPSSKCSGNNSESVHPLWNFLQNQSHH